MLVKKIVNANPMSIFLLNNNNSVMEYKINSDKFFGRQMLQDVKSDSTNDTYRHIIKKMIKINIKSTTT